MKKIQMIILFLILKIISYSNTNNFYYYNITLKQTSVIKNIKLLKKEKIGYISLNDMVKLISKLEESKGEKIDNFIIEKNKIIIFINDESKTKKFTIIKEKNLIKNNTGKIYRNIFLKEGNKYYIPLYSISKIFYDYFINFYKIKDGYFIYFSQELSALLYKHKLILKKENRFKISKDIRERVFLDFLNIFNIYYNDGNKLNKKYIVNCLKRNYLEKIINAESVEEYYFYFKEAIKELNNKHISIIPPFNLNQYNKVKEIELKNGDRILFYENKFFYKKVLETQKEIISINGRKVEGNNNFKDFFPKIDKRKVIKLRVKMDNVESKEIKVEKIKNIYQNIYFSNEIYSMDINKDSAYIYIPNFNNENFKDKIDEIFKKVKNRSKLIIDIRNNNGGLIENAIFILQYLTNKKMSFTMEYKNYNFSKTYNIKGNNFFKGKIVVLTNHNSFSAANLFAGFIKRYKIGKIIGEKTRGGISSTFAFILQDKTVLFMPVIPYYIGEDKINYSKGVKPDILIKDEIIEGRDKILEKVLKND